MASGPVTHDDAELLRRDDRYWKLGLIYACREDPRVIVRSRFVFGWTWNFGHRGVAAAIIGAIAAFFGPVIALAKTGTLGAGTLTLVCVIYLVGIVATAHYVASGPH